MNRVLLAAVLVVSGSSTRSLSAVEPVDFQRDIRPILSDNCFLCHGPDAATRESGLRLDLRDEALKSGDSGEPAIVPGQPDASAVVRRITSTDAGLKMPPEASGRQLSQAEIELLRQWVAEGAPYPVHWAFVPPRRPSLPAVRQIDWPCNPIDLFVLARLEREGWQPAPAAPAATLRRRLSLDLTGLPWFETGTGNGAEAEGETYERWVDQLLASPHYGERWGRHWLDAARYADSDGYEKDKPRSVWIYRDWVVQALNRNLPYNQFIIEQLAGDLLPQASQDQRVATGFLRNSMINEEGGIDPEQFRMEAMFDRMDAIGKGILGLTVQCCQCHDHKYDPLTREDYYRLFAYLNDTHEANIAVYTPAEQQVRADLFRQIEELEQGLQERQPDWRERMAHWERQVGGNPPSWQIVKVQNAGDNAQRYVYHADGSQTAWGYAPTKWASKFSGPAPLTRITGFRLELLTDPNLPLGGPGRSPLGLCALSEFQVEVASPTAPDKPQRVKLVAASADFANFEKPLEAMFYDKTDKQRVTGPVSYAIDEKDETAWGIDAGPGRRNVSREAVFIPEQPLELPEGAELTFHLKQMHGGWNSDDNQNNNLGRFRFAVTGAPEPAADPVPRPVRALLAIPADQRSPAQLRTLFSYWRTTVADWRETNDRIEQLWRQHPEGHSQLTLARREMPRQTFLLSRGDFLKPERPVEPGVPAALNPLPPDAPANRLGLAQWMVAPEAPTTARAIVNRVWQAYFGTGLVSTSEDLGVQSEPPTHPELLDWLTVEFIESGWNLKGLHRLIVTSATYRQSSHVPAENWQRDPANRLLARGPRFRIEGEVVRDIALAAGGLLNLKMGGPPVYPPAPEFLFNPPASYGPKSWNEDAGGNRYRRALYTFRFRSVPYPALTIFDTPNGDAACVRRVRSNTPLQALTTLNEPLFLEAARALARKVLQEGGAADEPRLDYAFLRCTGRVPDDRERALLLNFLRQQRTAFSRAEARPWDLAANDPVLPPALPEGTTPAEAAAWTSLARLLLNLDETITKE